MLAMKIESPTFTEDDYHEVIGGYFERERRHLIERLRAIAEKTVDLAAQLDGNDPSAGDDWNATETLAHVATTAQFFGWVVHEVTRGHDIAARMLDLMRLRDPLIVDMVQQSPRTLAQQVRESIDRTVAFLEDVPYDRFRTTIEFAGRALSAEDFTRVSLVHHLEDHLEQMHGAMEDRTPR
ncbi:MAG: DinB family protein [Actinomycetota bacterium]